MGTPRALGDDAHPSPRRGQTSPIAAWSNPSFLLSSSVPSHRPDSSVSTDGGRGRRRAHREPPAARRLVPWRVLRLSDRSTRWCHRLTAEQSLGHERLITEGIAIERMGSAEGAQICDRAAEIYPTAAEPAPGELNESGSMAICRAYVFFLNDAAITERTITVRSERRRVDASF